MSEMEYRHTLEGGFEQVRCYVEPGPYRQIVLKDTMDGHLIVLNKDEAIDLMAWLSEVTK